MGRLYWIYVFLIVFFLFPITYSVNYTFGVPSLIVNSTNAINGKIHSTNPEDNSYIFQYNTPSYKNYFAKTDGSFTLLSTAEKSIATHDNENVDCSSDLNNDFKCIGASSTSGGFYYWEIYSYDWGTNSFTTYDSITSATIGSNSALSSSGYGGLYLWKKTVAGNDLEYTLTNDIETGIVGDGTLNIPTAYHNLAGIEARYCGDFNILHVIANKGGQLYDIMYDLDLNYQNIYQITNTSMSVSATEFSVWCDESKDILKIFYMNNTNGIVSNAWINDLLISDDSYDVVSAYVYDINMTSLETSTNSTQNKYPFAPYYFEDDNGQGILTYIFRDGSNYLLKATKDTAACGCSGWVNTSVCNGDYRKQSRVCFGCNNTEVNYVFDVVCAIQNNQSKGIYEQQYYEYFKRGNCTTDNFSPPINLECRFKEQIPADCVNVSVSISAYPNWKKSGIGCNNGNWTLKVCNPDKSSDCSTNQYSCTDLNHTSSKTYDNYIAGQTATSSSFFTIQADCKCYILYNEWFNAIPIGITSVGMGSDFTVSCMRPYKQGWSCDENGIYERYVHIDNSITNETNCPYGCDSTTGRCFSKGSDNPENSMSIDFWINNIFNPQGVARYVHAVIWSSCIGILIVTLLGRGSENSGTFFLVGFGVGMGFFLIIGWLPIWIPIFVILVGLGGLAITKI